MSKIAFKFPRGQWFNLISGNSVHCGLLTSYGNIIWVNIGSGYGLWPDCTKPLPEPMLTQIYVRYAGNKHSVLWHMCLWLESSLVEVMAWCLFSAKPSPHPMIIHCQLDHSGLLWNYNKTIRLYIKIKKKTLWNYETCVTLVAIIGTTMP